MPEFAELPEEEKEFYEHYRFIVDPGQQPMRIDKFLSDRISNVSRSKIQSAADANAIQVNDKPVKSSYKIKPRDIITIVLPFPPHEFELIAEDIPINIVYEDNDILVINKDAGMVVHPGYGNFTGTLLNALLFHLKDDADSQPLLVHRIDKDTSGILVVAKNELSQAKLSKYFFDHSIDRRYVALVWGDFENDEGTITGYIGRNLRNRKMMDIYQDETQGRWAVTHFRVLERFRYVSLIECALETGRTHQIRAHMKHIGHPLFNDALYGGDIIMKGTTFSKYKQFVQNCFQLMPRQALHAQSLGFNHPSTGKYINFTSEIPQDMRLVIEKWQHYVQQL
ncbi:MAG TPA: RluA family pseudouridine synthase [Bacteroidales bacterium]|jgi:23S rRNA pseudouridine1911/1915/1917 synthase|nr:RluA family pseudouridine synthase [Bacteroidales bacterium]HPB24980.1 RluA family pseudouridine synthase [Bacteroidales bacterium]HPI30232.1 RluA family pseudouridine synthase [Bacteroidales bacterium]HQN15640.1 RluA family pseudouridine synthase [Bacteroidales bacterium]HQP15737.1 RluA family pseudouridine synthase [Bacteroidales bacterium]